MKHSPRPTYNLLREPWIPCEHPDGTRVLVGIEQALLEAHTFAAIHDESPLVTAMLHRLLLGLLHRAFAPRTMEDWLDLWESDRLDSARIHQYLGRWKDRFDLFHPERPFLQVAGLALVLKEERGKEAEPIAAWRLAMERSQHSGATALFEPLPQERDLEPAEATRALLGYLAFAPGGRIQNESESWKSGTLRPGAVVLVHSGDLRRTLLLNLTWNPERSSLDIPPWEAEAPTRRVARTPKGVVDTLVWASRRVELIWGYAQNGHVVVNKVITAAGERFEADEPDAMFAYVIRDPKKPPLPVRIESDRAVWRDSTALFEVGTGAGEFRRPAACAQLAELVREGVVARTERFKVDFLGIGSSQAAIKLWRVERMPLPVSLLEDGAKLSTLRDALFIAEGLGRTLEHQVLSVLAKMALAPSTREPHKDDINALKAAFGAMPAYWASLGQRFPFWIDALGCADDPEAELKKWKRNLRVIANSVVSNAANSLGVGSRAFQAEAIARRVLRRVLAETLGRDSVEPDNSELNANTEGIPQ